MLAERVAPGVESRQGRRSGGSFHQYPRNARAKIVADELSRVADSTRIDTHPIAAQKLLFIQNVGDRFGIEIPLALKVAIKAPSCEPRIRHNVVDRDGIEAMTVE
jgi:hypothetical protein